MTLDECLRSKNITSGKFAKRMGVSVHAVRKWRQRKRIPRPAFIMKINTATRGMVTPKDWYR